MRYRTHRAGILVNADCATRCADRLIARLEELADRHGRRVAIVGQSRGGSIARHVALRRPDLVGGIVSLGSPVLDEIAVHPLVWLHVRLVGRLGTLGVPGLLSRDCRDGECCAATRGLAGAPFPPGVGFTAIYSRSDGIVDWRACLDPAATHVEVDASHCGMAVHADTYRALADALAEFAADEPQRLAA
jgi:triacylglycerol lipase